MKLVFKILIALFVSTNILLADEFKIFDFTEAELSELEVRKVRGAKNKTIYTLLGWDGNDMFSNKKVIESMTINKKNKIQFGNSIFKYPDGKTKKRVIFQYNKKSYMSLKHKRIRKENYIVFDHLTPTSPHLKDFPDWYVTDLSFDAFKWDENKWIYINDFDAKSLKILRKPFNDPTKN